MNQCSNLPFYLVVLITAHKRSLGQGNIFTPVCHSVHRGGGVRGCSRGVCVVALGGACVVLFRGACVVLFGGCAWFYSGWVCVVALGGMHGCSGGACVVLFREACVVLFGGHAWFYSGGGMHGFFSFFGYNEIRSMSGRYASYWNAFLFGNCNELLHCFDTALLTE